MARMIPPVCAEGTSRGEQEIFRRLRDDPGTEDWVVLHSLNLARHEFRVEGEVDFVVVVPRAGVLCLEVKGHSRIRVEEGMWFFGTHSRGDSRGPFVQVSEALHSLKKFVSRESPHLKHIPFWAAAVFPFVEFGQRSTEWHDWQVIDRVKLRARPISHVLSEILSSARHELSNTPSARWFDPDAEAPSCEETERLIKVLRPSFEVFRPMSSILEEKRAELLSFTEEQYSSLDVMEKNPRVLFEGPAGTGKTVLALEAVRRASAAGRRTLFLCFNRLLGKTLQDELAGLEGVKAVTLHRHLLDTAGIKPRDLGSVGHDFWSHELPEAALASMVEGMEGPPWDTLVIDEAQDILREPYVDILDLSVKGGLSAGHYRMFADFDKQSIYGAVTQWPSVCRVSSAVFELRDNCRNTPRIAAYATLLGGLAPGYRRVLRKDDGVKPALHFYDSEESQSELLQSALDELRDAGFENRDIVVLSPRAERPCVEKLARPWKNRVCPIANEQPGRVRYSTIHAFKGLEAPAVVMTDIVEMENTGASDLFYVGVTRALHRLVVLASSKAKKDLQQILLA